MSVLGFVFKNPEPIPILYKRIIKSFGNIALRHKNVYNGLSIGFQAFRFPGFSDSHNSGTHFTFHFYTFLRHNATVQRFEWAGLGLRNLTHGFFNSGPAQPMGVRNIDDPWAPMGHTIKLHVIFETQSVFLILYNFLIIVKFFYFSCLITCT